MLWKVPTHIFFTTSSPIILERRSRISFAALLVNVTARILYGLTPDLTRLTIRVVKTFVFPLPAPASTSNAPSFSTTASLCSSLRPLSSSSNSPPDTLNNLRCDLCYFPPTDFCAGKLMFQLNFVIILLIFIIYDIIMIIKKKFLVK